MGKTSMRYARDKKAQNLDIYCWTPCSYSFQFPAGRPGLYLAALESSLAYVDYLLTALSSRVSRHNFLTKPLYHKIAAALQQKHSLCILSALFIHRKSDQR